VGEAKGDNDLATAVRTAVINKRRRMSGPQLGSISTSPDGVRFDARRANVFLDQIITVAYNTLTSWVSDQVDAGG